MIKFSSFSLWILILLSGHFGFSQNESVFPPPENPPVIQVIKAESKISVDGKLDEDEWQKGEGIVDFFKREPRQGGAIRYQTKVKFLYDNKYLYVGAWCKDSLGIKGIRVQDLRRDFSWGENDLFGVALDPQNLKQYAQAFQTTPYGNQRDFQNFNGNSFDIGWNTLWKVRTMRRQDGYTVEMAIPFKTLRYDPPKEGEPIEWGVSLVRYARRDIEVSTFPAIPQSFTPYRMTYAAKLMGIEVPKSSGNIRVQPYSLYQNERVLSDLQTTASNSEKFGGDIKWAINPRSVLDFTFNTDFAQAEVDRAVNNLERFNIFFPEQRQFFLENSGIWAGGSQTSIRPFFSRRIGLEGSFNAIPAPIEFGARYTNRTEEQALAALVVRQGETSSSARADFGVLRYLKNYGRENNIGIMLTQRKDSRNEDLDIDAHNNTTLTIDGQIRPNSSIDIQYLFSASIDELTGEKGFAGRFFAGRSTNKSYYGWVTEFTDEKYNPRMGFVRQNNVIRHNPGGYFVLRPKKLPWIRRWDPGAFFNYNHDANDPRRFQLASIYLFPVYTWFKDNSFLEVSFTPTWQNINFAFSPLGITIDEQQYYYTRYTLKYNTDRSKKWSVGMGYNFGDFYNGQRNTLTLSGRLAPIPHAAVTINYEQNDIVDLGLQKQTLTTKLVTLGSRFALNPRLQFSAFYQYNDFDQQGRWNIRTSWEFQPQSFIYLVFNDRQINSLDNPLNQQQFVTKINFVKQF